jgi:sugar/nucleoside kinase (ribokinase family)
LSIAVIGNVNLDVLIWPANQIPPPGSERPVERIDLRPGGAAAIAGATLARLGAEPIVVGCVGHDPAGDLVLQELNGYGVDTSSIERVDGYSTGVSVAFEDPGRDRSFLISLGCLAGFDGSMVPPEALAADQVLICGYFNLPAMRGAVTGELLRRVKDAGGMTLLDTGQDHDGWPERTRKEAMDLLPMVDVFLPNRSEAELLAGRNDLLTSARALQSESGGWIVVKLGEDGCLAVGPEGEEYRVDAPRVDVIDTTGAGDALNAALMLGLSDGDGWAEALGSAVQIASEVVSRPSTDRYPTARGG